MDRILFTKSIELPLSQGNLQNHFPEMMAIYNLIDTDKYKVEGHLLEQNKISFTVYCNKDDAVSISNKVQNHVIELYGISVPLIYNIHKDGIDLYMENR